MNNSNQINQLRKLFNKDVYHVFFIINPVVEIIIFLWIKLFNIPEENIIILKLRENPSVLINFKSIYFKKTILDRILLKIGYNRNARKYKNFIHKKSKEFYLYSSWVHYEFFLLLNDPYCKGHFYFEEGQISHRKKKFIDNKKDYSKAISLLNSGKKYAEQLDSYHQEDAINFVSIDPTAFPHINTNKKIILEDLSQLKEYYKPNLLGRKHIGIGPAPRRLKKNKLEESLIILSKVMPNNSIIKLHPGFQFDEKKLKSLEVFLFLKTKKNIQFCSDLIFLEIEMLFEQKYFYGDKSSLIRYAELFDSKYKIIDLYKK